MSSGDLEQQQQHKQQLSEQDAARLARMKSRAASEKYKEQGSKRVQRADSDISSSFDELHSEADVGFP